MDNRAICKIIRDKSKELQDKVKAWEKKGSSGSNASMRIGIATLSVELQKIFSEDRAHG